MKNFLKAASVCVIALLTLSSCGQKYTFNLDENIGLCGGLGKDSLLKSAGVAYIEAGVAGFLIPESSDEEFEDKKAIASESELPVLTANGFFPWEIKLVGPEADIERAVRYSETAIKRAAEIGMETLVLGSGRSRMIPEGFDRDEAKAQFVELLKRIAPCAEINGITIVLEPLNDKETNFLNSVREGTAICKEVGSPSICVLADFFHMARMNEDADAIREAGALLKHCHIAECEKRTAPGVCGDDFTAYFQALKDIRYTGRISFECGWGDQEAELPAAMKVMIEQINSVK